MATHVLAAVLLLTPAAALAHPSHGVMDLGAGLVHPLLGPDHLLAMAGIGFGAAWRRNGSGAGAICAVFLGAVVLGFGLGLGQTSATVVELGIVGSVLTPAVLILGARRLPMSAAATLAASFALCHGHAHGVEMALGSAPTLFGLGFALASAVLLGTAAGVARLAQRGCRLRSTEPGLGGGLLAAGVYLLLVV